MGLAWRVGFYPLRSVCVMFAFWISSICSHLGATGVGRSLLGNLDGGNDTCLHCWVCDDIVLIFGLTLAWHFLWRVCFESWRREGWGLYHRGWGFVWSYFFRGVDCPDTTALVVSIDG